jgi:hypothetical protein
VAEPSTDDVLRWEARQGPRAAIAAAVAAILIPGTDIAQGFLFNDRPVVGLSESLPRAAEPGPVGALPSLRTPYFQFYDDRATSALLVAVGKGLGYVALAFVLSYLGLAVRARTVAFKRFWIYIALAGGVISAVAIVLFSLGLKLAFHDFLTGPRTVDRARDIGDSALLQVATILGIPASQPGLGPMALGLGWTIICLNGMRVGLLTRFMGVLGIICGVLNVLPLFPLPIVQTFWLGAIALLLVGRWPNGVPPAWVTGEAQPWPSQQDAREARDAARRGSEPEPDPEPVTRSGDGRAHPSSRKKKRKRRA